MKDGPDIARIAALIGDPARANILTALMAGRALTASELALEAGVGKSTVSGHLAKLREGGLIQISAEGRHRYVTLAGAEVAAVLEGLMGLAAGTLRTRPGPKDPALREARVCYNHLAGRRGRQVYDSLRARGLLQDGPALSPEGRRFVEEFGIDLTALEAGRAVLCRDCLDWSERTHHLAGSLGRAILARLEALAWARRDKESRAVMFTPPGLVAFEKAFPV